MSLESQIADLVSATNTLITTFNTKKTSIDAAVAAAIAAIPVGLKNYYINPLTGDDTAVGSAAAPLKTLDKALSTTPVGGVCVAYLQTDYVMNNSLNVDGRFLHIRSDVSGVKRKITHNYYATSDGSATYLAGFVQYNGAQIMVSDLTFVLPSPAGLNPVPSGFVNALFKTNSSAGTVMCAVKMTGCEVIAPADYLGFIVGSPNCAIAFEVLNVQFPAGFGGRYITNVAAGTSSATLSNLLTNLSTL
ncbi:hypothetical protein [Pseudomonas moorei]|uniref:Uncharacterized protein n=1 Tax=Pseudomonas moorei TaxID=395599 RepID=A0A1H1EHK8_9PSED|nr:hypothetical protein [Pseudomonas moorei]KAB0507773.1 hypothetical protein F7R06_06360 [Pseudomonas moorei]SDQ88040.1 hypothetical protein SAMN04490195_2197 [Pseudomonas moorei]